MDAVCLFTRLEAERSGEIVKEETLRSKVKFENVDTNELGLFLRKNLTNEYIVEKGIEQYLPERVFN